MSRGNKKSAQLAHFQKRMLERFGVYISPETHNNLVIQIQEGKTRKLYDQSLRVKIHGIQIAEHWYVVAYDRLRKQIITVLPDCDFYKELITQQPIS